MEQHIERPTNFPYNPAMVIEPDVDFAALCKELRDGGKFTQQEMADRLGVTLRAYQKWEYGTRTPSTIYALRILALRDELDAKAAEAKKRKKN